MKSVFFRHRLAVALCFTLLTVGASAQELRIAYFGETISHYGVKIGLAFPLLRTEKAKANGLVVERELQFGPSLAIYRHPHHHVGVILAPELNWRRTGSRGGFYELGLAPSLYRYFLEADTYQVGDDGEFERVPLAGRFAFLPTVSVGLGRDLSVRGGIPLAWYLRLDLMRQFPYNAGGLSRFALEAGIIKKL